MLFFSLTWRALKPPLACCQLCCPDCCWLYEELELCWTDDCRRLRVVFLIMLPPFEVVGKRKRKVHCMHLQLRSRFHSGLGGKPVKTVRPTLKWLPDLQSTHSPFLRRQTSALCEPRWLLPSGLPCGLRLNTLCLHAALAVGLVAGSAFGDAQ